MSEKGKQDTFYIDFDTKAHPGKLQAVRIRIDLVLLEPNDDPLAINLCEHPLYPELKRYVEANR